MEKSVLVSEEKIVNRIYFVKGKRVMLDRDLAEMYEVPTKVLNQAVKRNLRRFPDDFMFQLTRDELDNLISQFVVASSKGEAAILKSQFVTSSSNDISPDLIFQTGMSSLKAYVNTTYKTASPRQTLHPAYRHAPNGRRR
jgi:hypothetical protein